jgi:cytoskeletal protein CcmA (bactofilin family)
MFKKDNNSNPGSFDTLIGKGTIFDGNIESEGTIRVDGKVKGNLKISGDVYIGTEAVIKGNISGENVHISGKVEGNVASNGILRLLSTARLKGDIDVYGFVSDEGAVFQGKCHMIESDEERAITEKTARKSKDYKKSSALSQLDEKEKNQESR